VYSVVDSFAGPAQFDFLVRSGDKQARQGELLQPGNGLVVEVEANGPPESTIVLLRDGRQIAESPGPRLRHELHGSQAVLRAEVRLAGRHAPWVVSNPVYIAQQTPPADPLPPPVTATRNLDEPDAVRRWHVEQLSGASGVLERSGNGPTVFRYTLAPDTPSQSVALVMPEGAALWEFDRVSFRASATMPMRLSVQLRQPGGQDGQRWRRSVYLDTVARNVTVFFSDVRPAGSTGVLKPDMARVDDLLFVVDTVNTKPGTSGAVTFEALSLQR
ncbi:MAG: hypothetical protein ACRD1Q_15485, partial [Vicinamibacterales bacterium]